MQRTPRRANSTPISRESATTAPFEAVYPICDVAAPRWATKEAVLMTEPPPASSRCGIPCFQRVQDVNLLGVFLCCKHGIPHLLDSGGGSVINTCLLYTSDAADE